LDKLKQLKQIKEITVNRVRRNSEYSEIPPETHFELIYDDNNQTKISTSTQTEIDTKIEETTKPTTEDLTEVEENTDVENENMTGKINVRKSKTIKKKKKNGKVKLLSFYPDYVEAIEAQLIDNQDNIIIPTSVYTIARAQIKNRKYQNKPMKETENPIIMTDMLLDTGCMVTTISTKFYEKLNPDHKTKDLFDKTSIRLKNCHNEKNKLKGITTLKIKFFEHYQIEIRALISDKLSQDFILGYDFLGHDRIKAITKTAIIVNKKHQGRLIKIGILERKLEPIKCQTTETVTLESQKMSLVPFTITNQKNDLNSFQFTHGKSFFKNLQALPTAYTYNSKENRYLMPIFNDSLQEILLRENSIFSNIEIFEDEAQEVVLETNRMEIFTQVKENIISNSNIFLNGERKINDQKAFSHHEKEELKEKLLKNGYFKQSVTDFIKQKSSITELKLEKIKKFSEKEFLQQFDLKNMSDDHKKMAQEIILKHKPAFALHQYDIGKTNLLKMNIKVDNEKPKMQKFIPIPMHAKEKVKEILDQLKKYDIIRECNEPSNYCSNILVIKKRDGKSIRLLFDGRLLNYDTPRLPMATTSKLEILSHLANKTHLSCMDLADAFFHIELDEESQPLTAFYSSVHSQRFCFKRAPQGLRNSPLYLKLLLDKIFADMHDSCILFFDDLLIATNGTLEHHLKVIDEVLRRIVLAGLKLRPNKLNIAKKQIEFLGMIFQKGKLSIPEAKLKAFKELPSPNTPKKCKSLICALSYYRHFVPNFAELSREIMELANVHPKTFKWTTDHEIKLRTLIDEICRKSQLYLPDPKKRFYVQTDSSQNCGAGRIFQKDEKGNEMLIAAVSRVYSKTERSYSIFKKEILALLYTLKSMDYFLRFADKLTILVDAKSILFLRLAKDSSGILLRFSLELSKYDATINHVSGEENIISDVLSRQNEEINNILAENLTEKPLTEKQSVKILEKLTLKKNYSLSPEELKMLLGGQSPTITSKTPPKKSKALLGERQIKNTPVTLTNKKLNLPKLSMRRPGIILKKRERKSKSLELNVLTRAMNKILSENKSTKVNAENADNGAKKEKNTPSNKSITKKKRAINQIDDNDANEHMAEQILTESKIPEVQSIKEKQIPKISPKNKKNKSHQKEVNISEKSEDRK